MAGMLDFAVQNAGAKLNSYLANNYQPGAYGEMQGYLTAKEEQRAQNKDMREERTLNMAEEAFGWKREEHQKEQILQAGMRQAAQDGGYEGVIAYLEKADPERAINFTSAKVKLDEQIMNNDVLKNIKIPQMREEALLDSYGKLGQMGAAILKAPAEVRDTMYQRLLPLAKQINPEMPDTLQEAAPTLLLAAAQATPANQFFAAGKKDYEAKSQVGKIGQDIESYIKAGVGINDESAQGDTLRSLVAEQERWRFQSAATGAKLTQLQLQQTRDKNQAEQMVSKNLAQASVINPDYIDSYLGIRAALNVLAKDPNNSEAQAAVGRSFVKAYNKGVASDQDNAIQYGAAGLGQLYKKVKGLMNNEVVNLNPEEIANIAAMNESLKEQKLQYQKNIESEFEKSVADKSDLVKWSNIVKPSQMLTEAQQQATANVQAANGEIPADLQSQANDAIQKGADPAKVQARVQEIMAKRAQAAKSLVDPILTPKDYAGE